MKTQVGIEIINYIKRNRVSTTEVADCLGKKGAIRGIWAVNSGKFVVGFIKYVYAFDDSNWSIHQQIRKVNSDEVVFADAINVSDRAVFGELVSKYILLYKQAAGIICNGLLRDANDLIKNNYPIWCKGFTPEGCYNEWRILSNAVDEVATNRREIYEDAIAVCDDTGVVVIPQSEINNEFLCKLEYIERQEDEWFECIDRRKWDTYDTVCLKKYTSEYKPKLIAVGGAEGQAHIIECARNSGYYVIDVDKDGECYCRGIADEFQKLSTDDVNGIAKLAMERKVDSIVASQSDLGIKTAYLCRKMLGIEAEGDEAINLFTNKHRMREFLKKEGYACPDYKLCSSEKELNNFVSKHSGKCVAKPIDSQGSRGVTIIDTNTVSKYKDIAKYSSDEKSIIIEEYLGNEEYTVEGIIVDGIHYSLAISKKKHYENLSCVACELRYEWDEDDEKLNGLAKLNSDIIEKTGLKNSVTHAEYLFFDGRFYLVEFAARGGGSMISSHIVPIVSGVDSEKIYLNKILKDNKQELVCTRKRKYAVLKFIELEEGIIKKICGLDTISAMPNIVKIHINYQVGEKVDRITNDTNRHGFYIAYADTEEELNDIEDFVEKNIKVIYESR